MSQLGRMLNGRAGCGSRPISRARTPCHSLK